MSAAMHSVRRTGRSLLALLLLLLLAAGALAGCASSGEVQRANQGPTADEVWLARFVLGYGRAPTYDEKVAWKEGLESRILAYFARRPEVATSPRASQIRFQRGVMVGMEKDEVVLLLDQPDTVTSDEAAMRAAAGRFWGPIGAHAKEMWTYPPGWHLYFDGDRLVDVIVADHSPLE
jgi:hypothetical protein